MSEQKFIQHSRQAIKYFILITKLIDMKSFKFMSAALLVTVILASCGNDGNSKTEAASEDTPAIAENKQVDDTHQKLEANKEIARSFIQSLYGDKDSTAVDKYVADDIKQHDPILQDGKQWLRELARQLLSNPNFEKTKIDIKYISAEDDMVWTLIREAAPNGKVFARVEIYRIKDQKITERWLISQPEPKTSANKNTMF
jgi:predicted SnoaL-like aldol condensation-catalyzing enzyme